MVSALRWAGYVLLVVLLLAPLYALLMPIEIYSNLLHEFESGIKGQPQSAGRRQRLAELKAMAIEATRIRAAYQLDHFF